MMGLKSGIGQKIFIDNRYKETPNEHYQDSVICVIKNTKTLVKALNKYFFYNVTTLKWFSLQTPKQESCSKQVYA